MFFYTLWFKSRFCTRKKPTLYNGDSSYVYPYAETPACFLGETSIRTYIKDHIHYPERAIKEGLAGLCYVRFIVEKDGTLTDVKIMRGVVDCPECDREVLRLVREMPTWKPGEQQGVAVRSYYNLKVIVDPM